MNEIDVLKDMEDDIPDELKRLIEAAKRKGYMIKKVEIDVKITGMLYYHNKIMFHWVHT